MVIMDDKSGLIPTLHVGVCLHAYISDGYIY